MGIFTKFNLLLITIVVISQTFFAGQITTGILPTPTANKHNSPNSITSANVVETNTIFSQTSVENVNGKQEVHFTHEFSKHSKKYRQTSVYPGLKIPVKYLDEVSIFINSITTYSRPYFLTHLHHFLFRLTPF